RPRPARTGRPPPPPALPEVEALRQQVLGGDRQGARAGLHQRLAARPGDADAWTLLAQLEARDGRPDDAVAAWREVIARGSPAAAQRARFEAAVLLERRPAEVIPLLEVFLASPDPLAAEAGLRLGRARLAVGDREGAVRALEQVAREHPGTGPAAEALQLSK
ncbi:MAG: tetratricopeptide repeat protein, partial [Myxococcota bacterium]